MLVAILLVVGLAAGAASFTHVHDWTMTNSPDGTPDWFGWANACISELVPVAALLEIRRRRRADKPTGYPLALLIAAAGLSLSAQLAVAKPGVSGALLSAVPALAFMALVKLIFSATPSRVADVATSPAQVADVTPAAAVASPVRVVAERPARVAAVATPATVAAARPSPARVVAQVAEVTPSPRDKATTPRPARQSAADAIRAAAAAGATPATVAAALGVSVRTAQRHWPRPTVATSPALAGVTA
ncbi:hypothetical protein ACLQ3H_00370 [Micromonospora saelicesensis]|uniref:hypothetical protein n=1 Tax=Micromonospora saelicesensis TaxID=285676 RepID=UPI003CEE94BB